MSAASNEINLRQTLSFLSDPASYTDNPETVECVETRMSSGLPDHALRLQKNEKTRRPSPSGFHNTG